MHGIFAKDIRLLLLFPEVVVVIVNIGSAIGASH